MPVSTRSHRRCFCPSLGPRKYPAENQAKRKYLLRETQQNRIVKRRAFPRKPPFSSMLYRHEGENGVNFVRFGLGDMGVSSLGGEVENGTTNLRVVGVARSKVREKRPRRRSGAK